MGIRIFCYLMRFKEHQNYWKKGENYEKLLRFLIKNNIWILFYNHDQSFVTVNCKIQDTIDSSINGFSDKRTPPING